MCGFFGALGAEAPLREAAKLLAHRGPDDEGFLEMGPLRLAFRRLAIVDPEGGHQPITDGVRALVFNGEIYNFRELGYDTRSDARALFYALRDEGLAVLPRLRGIFAFAYWDGGKLFLVRDRLGVKPLYYARLGGGWAFSSEAKPLLRAGVPTELSEPALAACLSLLWCPSPLTPFKGIKKLPPGHWLELPSGRLVRWWRPEREKGGSVSELAGALSAAVKEELLADVQVGLFLSGGLDSSAVAALVPEPLDAITLSPAPEDLARDIVFDESPYAELVAKRFGHRLHRVSLSPSPELAERLAATLSEPLGDSAAYAVYLMSIKARELGLKAVLSGVGGDELFGGYPRHRARRLLSVARLLRWAQGVLERLPFKAGRLGRLRRDALKLLRAEDYLGFYIYLRAQELAELLAFPVDLRVIDQLREEIAPGYLGALDFDLLRFLPDNNLLYTDQASMAAGVEVRVPLLNPRVLDAALRLPQNLLVWKRALKRALAGTLPFQIIKRKKAGLGSPVRGWVRGPLAEWLRAQLEALPPELFNPRAALRWHDEEIKGKGFRYLTLWQLGVMSVWLREFWRS